MSIMSMIKNIKVVWVILILIIGWFIAEPVTYFLQKAVSSFGLSQDAVYIIVFCIGIFLIVIFKLWRKFT